MHAVLNGFDEAADEYFVEALFFVNVSTPECYSGQLFCILCWGLARN